MSGFPPRAATCTLWPRLPRLSFRPPNEVLSFVVLTVLFACILRFMPSVPLQWSDVMIGAVLTSLLFVAGKFLLGVYLGKTGFANTYGAAGSLVVLLV